MPDTDQAAKAGESNIADPVLALIQAALDVKKKRGRWFMGAPSHVFAELLTALEARGFEVRPKAEPEDDLSDEEIAKAKQGLAEAERGELSTFEEVFGEPLAPAEPVPPGLREALEAARENIATRYGGSENNIDRELIEQIDAALDSSQPSETVAAAGYVRDEIERARADIAYERTGDAEDRLSALVGEGTERPADPEWEWQLVVDDGEGPVGSLWEVMSEDEAIEGLRLCDDAQAASLRRRRPPGRAICFEVGPSEEAKGS